MADSKIYTCDMSDYSSVCREFHMTTDKMKKLDVLKKNCLSMAGSKFYQGSKCSGKKRIAKCTKIHWDEHDKTSLQYDNHYYGGGKNNWNIKKTRRICKSLEGHLSK
jgi:hypothetical protein